VLAKNSSTNFDTGWITSTGGGGGITSVGSSDGTVIVTNTTGPAVNLQVQKTISVFTTFFTSNAYTLALSDAQSAQQCANATAATITIPNNSTVAFPIGTQISFTQTGSGKIQLATAGGVTVQSPVTFTSGTTGTRTQYSTICILKTATNTWVLTGDIA